MVGVQKQRSKFAKAHRPSDKSAVTIKNDHRRLNRGKLNVFRSNVDQADFQSATDRPEGHGCPSASGFVVCNDNCAAIHGTCRRMAAGLTRTIPGLMTDCAAVATVAQGQLARCS